MPNSIDLYKGIFLPLTNKIKYQQQNDWVWRDATMEHLSDDAEDHPSQYENSYKLCDEKGHAVLILKKSQ